MPTEYRRKPGSTRGSWTTENLREAITRIRAGEIGINEAERYYGIPSRTLRRRRDSANLNKGPLGPQSVFGPENEKKLVAHLQRLEKSGFAPDRTTVRKMAFELAEKLKLNHSFNKEKCMAGYDWLNSFLRRNKELTIRKAEGLSLSRAEGMNREEVNAFFETLTEIFNKHEFYTKPGSVFNMDETGCQLNNVTGKVIATKGAKDVHAITSAEKGENVSITACINGEGTIFPPVLIFKGQRENEAYAHGLPPGSLVFMNPKSSYISAELFYRWLKEHFCPRKPPGKVLLILDGHTAHKSSIEMLEFADENDIILLWLPSHTTHALQPLDRSFFKPFKGEYQRETANWIKHNPHTSIKKIHAGTLIGNAWTKSASMETCINGFRATGIFPLDSTAIPDRFFATSDLIETQNSQDHLQQATKSTTCRDSQVVINDPQPSTSNSSSKAQEVETPSKLLDSISPVPRFVKHPKSKRKKSVRVLDEDFIEMKRMKQQSKKKTNTDEKRKTSLRSSKIDPKITGKIAGGSKSDKDDNDPELLPESTASNSENECLECLEDYYETQLQVEWVKCVDCSGWLHETCTLYNIRCNTCGRKDKLKKNPKK